MSNTVKLKSGESFSCAMDETILDAALRSGMFLPHSCKTGQCGTCAVRVEGSTVPIHSETYSLGGVDNTVLSCTRTARSDILVDCENLAILANYPVRTLPARIVSIDRHYNDVAIVKLRVPPSTHLKYISGQYLDLIVKDNVRRSYSIANSPRENGILELHIKKVEDGVLSTYFFSEAKENDLLRLNGPLGSFFLRPERCRHLILLATGTGIAPIKAMLEQLDQESETVSYDSLTVFWGGRHKRDFYWEPRFNRLNVRFYNVLSREFVEGYYRGYVQDALIEEGIPLVDATVYACGSLSMIESAKYQLVEHGLLPNRFYSDAFVSSAEDIR